MSHLSKSSRAPVLCYVTDRHLLSQQEPSAERESLLLKIEEAASAGVDWIQMREKDLSGKDCATLTRDALQRARKASINRENPARVFVNDRLDVAIAEGAGGVHLGESSLPVAEAKRLVGSCDREMDFLIGVSCHSIAAAKAAANGGADYIFYGPVFATPSKTAYGSPQGLARLAEVCRAVSLPVLAIGGVTSENAGSCLSAGAQGIAAIRLFQNASDPAPLVKAIRSLIT